jgi:hypothetical protein
VQQVGGQECGEHLVRIRILEQEAERHLRRVQNLEHQLADMEKKTQERVEQVLTKSNILNPQFFCVPVPGSENQIANLDSDFEHSLELFFF